MRERDLSKMVSLCKTHMNSHPDVQVALSRERNLWINGNNVTTFLIGSSEPPEEELDQEDAPSQEQDDPMGEKVVDSRKAESEEDYVVEQATRSSISAPKPRVLYEAGIICARCEDGRIKHYQTKALWRKGHHSQRMGILAYPSKSCFEKAVYWTR